MPNRSIKIIVLLGGLAIAGIIFIQSYLAFKTWDLKEQEFNETVNLVLRKVAEGVSKYNGSELPKTGLIKRRSSNYYSVNINSTIDANVLEDYLYQELENHSMAIDFEYAVYDCLDDQLVYGNYCQLSEKDEGFTESVDLPKFDELIYYFVVKFPSRESYLLSNMAQTILFSLIALLAIAFFIYAIWIILRQKQLTELQKDFINNMTHEFKTPISSIKLASEVLKSNPAIQQNDRLTQYTNIIHDQNKRLNNQVEKVLNLARLENDQFKLNKEANNIDKLVSEIIADEKLKFEEKNGKLEANLNTADFTTGLDRLHITNVITNLLDNALKYCDKVPHTIISTSIENDDCLIQITDNGIGIKEEDQKKLFTKFFRVHTGNVHDVKGFGLGLFYVKNIVAEHGWTLSLKSKQSLGTTITIKIPHQLKIK